MIQPATVRTASRISPVLRDFVIGLGMYAILLTGATYLSNDPVPIFASTARAAAPEMAVAAMSSQPAASVNRAPDTRQATLILGLAFASLTAFNLAVLRHLRRVYASPR
jgi:hypothetical protein